MVDKSGVSSENKTRFKEAITTVVSNMPEKAVGLLKANTERVRFYDSGTELTRELLRERPEYASRLSSPTAVIQGYYSGNSKGLNLNGPHRESWRIQGLYAHEMTHAIDGPDRTFSSTLSWEKAWRREIRGGGLSSYAGIKSVEGFAEFGRAVYAGDVPRATLEIQFPRATRFWKENGLWPTT
jgi:hypothetical protein